MKRFGIKHIAALLAAALLLAGCGTGIATTGSAATAATTGSAAAAATTDSNATTDGSATAAGGGVYTSLADLAGKRIAVQMGSIFDKVVSEKVPDAELLYFNSFPDEVTALDANKLEGVPTTKMIFSQFEASDKKGYAIINEPIGTIPLAYLFPKTEEGARLRDQMNEFLTGLSESGEMEALQEKWRGTDEAEKPMEDYSALPATNGSLKFVTEGTYPPFNYLRDGMVVGYDVELATLFCKAYGYGLAVDVMAFDALMPAIQAGKYDFAASGITITEERAETVYFSVPNIEDEIVIMVKAPGAGASAAKEPEFKTFDDLDGKTVSMITGAPFEDLVRSKAPGVKEITYFTSMADMMLAVSAGKTDAGFTNNAVGQLAVNRSEGLVLFPESLGETAFGFAFDKGDARYDEWQAAFEKIPQEEKDALWEKWTGADDSVKTLPEQDWPGKNGTLKVAACDTLEPMTYAGPGGGVIGFDIEMLLRIARELDVHLEFEGMEFAGVLSAVQSGKADIGCGCILVTDERRQASDFVEYYPGSYVLVVRATNGGAAGGAEEEGATGSFAERVKESFRKTFIRESRWKLFLSGIGTTILITGISILLGTLLGFGTFMACRNGNRVANAITKVAIWLVRGMPVVVLLMILYYVVFGNVNISGTLVSVLGFTLIFGAAVYGMLKVGVGAVSPGQMEAASALGYGNRKAFYRVILPQAVPHVMPVYQSEVVSLIKATAIVGYIAVQDLTRMGDLIRSRTYDAFFPLIAVAILYFVLAGILNFFVKQIGKRINWRMRGKGSILKGVDIHD